MAFQPVSRLAFLVLAVFWIPERKGDKGDTVDLLKTEYHRVAVDRTLTVGTLEMEPYFRVIPSGANREPAYEGYIPDLMVILSRRLRFKYRFLIYPPVYGYKDNVTGNWTGLIGEVIKNQNGTGNGIDMAAAPISITGARQEVVDFVRPFQNLGMSILMQRTKHQEPAGHEFMIAFQPIDSSVWAMTLALMVLVWAVLWLMNIYNPHDYGCRYKLGLADKAEAELFNLSGTFWFVFSTLQWQGYERAPRSVASRFVGFIWFAYVTLFLTIYIAGVVHNLVWISLARTDATGSTERPLVNDLAHLMTSRTDYKVGAIAESQTFRYVTEVAAGYEFKALRNQWLVTKEGMSLLAPNLTVGLQRVRHEKYALIVESAVAKLLTNRRPCDLVTVGPEFGRRSYGLALPRGSPLLQLFNAAVLELTEDGTLEDLERRWYTDRGECWNVTAWERLKHGRSRLYPGKPKQLDANGFWAPLVLIIAGVIITCGIAGAEILYYRYKCKYSGTPSDPSLQSQHIRLDPDEGNM